MNRPGGRAGPWLLLGALWLLSAVPIAAGLVRLLGLASGGADGPANARFVAAPVPVAVHVLGAALFCVLGAAQFTTPIRHRWPRLHRRAGRVVAPCGVLAALSGLWMTVVYPIPDALQGDLLYAVRLVVGSVMAAAIVVAVRAVRRGHIASHRAWMIRAYALGQGAGTQVLILLPLALVAGEPTGGVRDVLMVSAWGLNVALAEWIVRRGGPAA